MGGPYFFDGQAAPRAKSLSAARALERREPQPLLSLSARVVAFHRQASRTLRRQRLRKKTTLSNCLIAMVDTLALTMRFFPHDTDGLFSEGLTTCTARGSVNGGRVARRCDVRDPKRARDTVARARSGAVERRPLQLGNEVAS
jgi:hypothetical protein